MGQHSRLAHRLNLLPFSLLLQLMMIDYYLQATWNFISGLVKCVCVFVCVCVCGGGGGDVVVTDLSSKPLLRPLSRGGEEPYKSLDLGGGPRSENPLSYLSSRRPAKQLDLNLRQALYMQLRTFQKQSKLDTVTVHLNLPKSKQHNHSPLAKGHALVTTSTKACFYDVKEH